MAVFTAGVLSGMLLHDYVLTRSYIKRDISSYVYPDNIVKYPDINKNLEEALKRVNDYDLAYENLSDAELVKESLVDIAKCYGYATPLDLYDLSGIDMDCESYNCFKNYGWTSEMLRTARIKSEKGYYFILLPKTIYMGYKKIEE